MARSTGGVLSLRGVGAGSVIIDHPHLPGAMYEMRRCPPSPRGGHRALMTRPTGSVSGFDALLPPCARRHCGAAPDERLLAQRWKDEAHSPHWLARESTDRPQCVHFQRSAERERATQLQDTTVLKPHTERRPD